MRVGLRKAPEAPTWSVLTPSQTAKHLGSGPALTSLKLPVRSLEARKRQPADLTLLRMAERAKSGSSLCRKISITHLSLGACSVAVSQQALLSKPRSAIARLAPRSLPSLCFSQHGMLLVITSLPPRLSELSRISSCRVGYLLHASWTLAFGSSESERHLSRLAAATSVIEASVCADSHLRIPALCSAKSAVFF